MTNEFWMRIVQGLSIWGLRRGNHKSYIDPPCEFLNGRIGFKMTFEIDVIPFLYSILHESGPEPEFCHRRVYNEIQRERKRNWEAGFNISFESEPDSFLFLEKTTFSFLLSSISKRPFAFSSYSQCPCPWHFYIYIVWSKSNLLIPYTFSLRSFSWPGRVVTLTSGLSYSGGRESVFKLFKGRGSNGKSKGGNPSIRETILASCI